MIRASILAVEVGEKNGAMKSAMNFEFSAFVHDRSILIGLK